ncbi:PP2C family serine/threonine-protein phosphatase [Bacillus sp. B1-b2]|uniref:PP2C family serine/threonine-protein phosphatase n=1 Tax=Bacillus sp. B1-b2 TaxID=2653201 RepID=UPI00126237B0|nr:PP2C family serine/threonine-protein phosphatase [Bacillus sp. B1-b2]KAB7663467.1 SpoIIE family protein phosphatase [Bacillus sp. B1-b2]
MMELQDHKVHVLSYQTSKKGKEMCGDSFYYISTEDYFLCMLADGLGSGEYAYEASNAVAEVIKENHTQSVEELMELSNQILIKKRGAAVCVFKIDYSSQTFEYSCVGNIRFFLYSPSGKLTYPLPVTGYLSGRPQQYHTQTFSYEENAKFLVFSDGFNIQGIKNLLKGYLPIDTIADKIIGKYHNVDDDSTFILGSLL